MTLCVLCAEPTLGDGELSPAPAVVVVDVPPPPVLTGSGSWRAAPSLLWVAAEACSTSPWLRIMCDFLHRGIVPPAPPDRLNALDVPIETLDEALVP